MRNCCTKKESTRSAFSHLRSSPLNLIKLREPHRRSRECVLNTPTDKKHNRIDSFLTSLCIECSLAKDSMGYMPYPILSSQQQQCDLVVGDDGGIVPRLLRIEGGQVPYIHVTVLHDALAEHVKLLPGSGLRTCYTSIFDTSFRQ